MPLSLLMAACVLIFSYNLSSLICKPDILFCDSTDALHFLICSKSSKNHLLNIPPFFEWPQLPRYHPAFACNSNRIYELPILCTPERC